MDLAKFAGRFGFQVCDMGSRYGSRIKLPYYWNEGKISVFQDLTVSELLHEMAHYCVAHPAEKNKIEFGYDNNPSGLHIDVVDDSRMTLSFGKGPRDEECAASVLGILAEKVLGFTWEQTLEYHNWKQYTDGEFQHMVTDLRDAGFLIGDVPAFLYGKDAFPHPKASMKFYYEKKFKYG